MRGFADTYGQNGAGAARSGLLGAGISPRKKEVDILMKMFRRDEGFTLVELMVVVLIIGILVAIAIPVFNAAQNTARERACFSNQRVIEGAIQQYLATNTAATLATFSGTSVTGLPLVGQNAFIKEIPRCGLNASLAYSIDTTGSSTSCPVATNGHGRYQ
jgi:prepilin-type N-terminal cleavage/methylation domain-containing protein